MGEIVRGGIVWGGVVWREFPGDARSKSAGGILVNTQTYRQTTKSSASRAKMVMVFFGSPRILNYFVLW